MGVFLKTSPMQIFCNHNTPTPSNMARCSLRRQTYRFELSGNWAQTVFDQTSVLQAIK